MKKNELTDVMENLEDDRVEQLVKDLMSEGCEKNEIIDLLNLGVKKVGDKYEQGEYFIADLIVSGIMYRSALAAMNIGQGTTVEQPIGKVVIGIMENDYHDIGKDIVVDVLTAEGFQVIDLGVNVLPDQFLQSVIVHKPDILLLGGTMKYVHESMKETIRLLTTTGLRGSLTVFIGGSCVDSKLSSYVLADGQAVDAMDALKLCKEVVGKAHDC